MNMILLTIISPCRIPQSIQKMVKRAGEIPAGQRRWALGQRICAHCLVYRYIYSKFWGCDFQGQGALHRKNSRKGPFAASEWTKLKSLLARRVPSSCKPAKGHSNLTLINNCPGYCAHEFSVRTMPLDCQARPAGHHNPGHTILQAAWLSHLQHFHVR